MAWGEAYDAAAADILAALDGLEAAYGSVAYHTRTAASLYAFTEQVAGGAPMPYEVPPEPHARALCPVPAASAVGGRFPVIPEFGQFIADFAGRVWPSGDAEAMRAAAAAWSLLAAEVDASVAKYWSAATAPLAGQRAADITLLNGHHSQLYLCGSNIAEACRSLSADCNRMAEAVEAAHTALADEAAMFVQDVAISVGVSVLVSVLSAGAGALLAHAAAAARLKKAADRFAGIIDQLADQSAYAKETLRTTGSALAASLPQPLRAALWPVSHGARKPLDRLGHLNRPSSASRATTVMDKYGDQALALAAAGPVAMAAQGLSSAAKWGLKRTSGHLIEGPLKETSFKRTVIDKLAFGSMVSVLSVGGYRLQQRAQNASQATSPEGFFSPGRASVPALAPVTITIPAQLRSKLGATPQPVRQDAAERGFLASRPTPSSSPGRRTGDSKRSP
ncbi:hypothetical protein [Crystallibacter crystallopoietes]|nr:hypothetical protein [Arthrobacter crystallopoietes]